MPHCCHRSADGLYVQTRNFTDFALFNHHPRGAALAGYADPEAADFPVNIVGSGRCRRTGRQRSFAVRWGNSEQARPVVVAGMAQGGLCRSTPRPTGVQPVSTTCLSPGISDAGSWHDMVGHKRTEQPLVPKPDTDTCSFGARVGSRKGARALG